MEFLSAVLMFPLHSLWDQCDFNKSCAFLSTFKFGCAEVSHGFYIQCLFHLRVNIFLISSCIIQCLILLGLLPTGTWRRTWKVHLPANSMKDLVPRDLLISLIKHITVLIYVGMSCLTWRSGHKSDVKCQWKIKIYSSEKERVSLWFHWYCIMKGDSLHLIYLAKVEEGLASLNTHMGLISTTFF